MQYIIMLPCAIVIIGCICRMDMLSWQDNKHGWLTFFTVVAGYCGDVAIDALTGRPTDLHDWFAVTAFLMYLHLTHKLWQAGPPPATRRAK